MCRLHSRSSADQQFRAQGSAHRTYYCCTFSIVHVGTCSVRSCAVLCKTISDFSKKKHFFSFFYCERSELLLYKKLCTVRCWICPAIKNVGENRGEMGIPFVIQDAAHQGLSWTFPLYRPLRFLEQFRTLGFLQLESTAVQRCARKSTEFASG